MKNNISIENINIENKEFWKCFFRISYPNAYEEEMDLSAYDILDEMASADIVWWEQFTGYYEGVLEESDGYLEEPTTLEVNISEDEILRVEFHPGDTKFLINDKEAGCTGPHWKLQSLPYSSISKLLKRSYGKELFFLLLPLAFLTEKEEDLAKKEIASLLPVLFPEEICEKLSQCIVSGFMVD